MDLEQALRAAGMRDLRTFTDAWNIDVVRRDDPEEYVDQALSHRQSIATDAGVEAKLEFKGLPYRKHMLAKSCLRLLLDAPSYRSAVDEFHAQVITREADFREWASRGQQAQCPQAPRREGRRHLSKRAGGRVGR